MILNMLQHVTKLLTGINGFLCLKCLSVRRVLDVGGINVLQSFSPELIGIRKE